MRRQNLDRVIDSPCERQDNCSARWRLANVVPEASEVYQPLSPLGKAPSCAGGRSLCYLLGGGGGVWDGGKLSV